MTDAETTAPVDRLIEAGLRPTRQRVALARLLFDGGDRHVTAEALHGEATAAGQAMALATVYNTLHQFTEAGLLREVVIEAGRSYFDTNIRDHHHFYHEATRACCAMSMARRWWSRPCPRRRPAPASPWSTW